MTCIVGVVEGDRVLIGGDSAGVDESYSLCVRADRKVFVNGPFVMGFTSSFRMGQLLQYAFTPPNIPSSNDEMMAYMVVDFIDGVRKCLKDAGFAKVDDNVESGGTFLVGVRGRLFRISDDFQVGESIHKLDACGCGEGIALGSLLTSQAQGARKRIFLALSAAEMCSAGVRSPFHVEEA